MTDTISFRCPKCNNMCGFDKKYAGYGAKCVNCQTQFYIPYKDGDKPRLYNRETEKPETGFYRNIFTSNFKAFADKESIIGLVFITAAVCFEFFAGHADYSLPLPGFRFQMPIGQITMLVTRGILFWYYGEVICWAAMEINCLPDLSIGSGFEFIWNVIKNTYLFIVSLIMSMMPFAIIASIIESVTDSPLPITSKVLLFIMGLFISPLLLITIFAGRRLDMIFRIDYIVRPLFKAFLPFVFVSIITIVAGSSQLLVYFSSIGGYGQLQKHGALTVGLFLFLNLLVTAITIFAMRTIGLFCRHFRVYMPHIWANNDIVRTVS